MAWIMRLKARLFHAWFLATRPMTLGVRALALDAHGHVLLVRHTYVEGWHLPGGGVEPGETALASLERELEEEAHCRIGAEPELLGFHYNHRVSRRDHVAVYLCRDVVQVRARAADREILEARFFAPDALPDGTTAATMRRIAEHFGGVSRDPYW